MFRRGTAIGAIILMAACTVGREESIPLVPDRLEGRWTTDDEPYAGRFFEITDTTIVFGTGDAPDVYAIVDVQTRSAGNDPTYTLYYAGSAGASRREFTVEWDRGELIIRNRPGVRWVKEEG